MPFARQRTVRIDHGRRFGDDAVAFLPTLRIAADFADHAAELVAQHHRVLHRPALLGRPHVQIAAADADGLHFEQDLVVANRRPGNLPQFDAVFLGTKIDNGLILHDAPSSSCSRIQSPQ